MRNWLLILIIGMMLVPAHSASSLAAPMPSERPLTPPPESVWINGTTVELRDTKLCWKRDSRPKLTARIDGRIVELAKAKLVRTGCLKNYPFEARYRFKLKLKNPPNAISVRSAASNGDGASFKRTVYASVAEYNNVVVNFLDILDRVIKGDSSGSSNSRPGSVIDSMISGWSGCWFKGKYMSGRVKVVEFGLADFTVKPVQVGEDLRVKFVSSRPRECGEWQLVDSGLHDFSVKFVEAGNSDLKIKPVDFRPGR